MWKLLNKLFGWDYIQWHNSCDSGVARVYADHSGRAYYWRYKGTRLADEIRTPQQVLWLTCHPSKYMSPFAQLAARKVPERYACVDDLDLGS